MLKKLFKHDMKYMSRSLPLIFAGVLAITILMSGFMALLVSLAPVDNQPVLISICMICYFIFLFSTVLPSLTGFAAQVIHMVRVYKNMFSQEGYLTFTLPVSQKDIVKSKILAGGLWQIIAGIVTVLCLVILIGAFFGCVFIVMLRLDLFSTGPYPNEDPFTWEMFLSTFGENWYINIISLVVGLIASVVSCFASSAMVVLAFSLGNMVKKGKILLSVAMHLGITWAVSGITSIGSLAIQLLFVGVNTVEGINVVVLITSILSLVLSVALLIASYIGSCRIAKYKLNLT